MPLAAVTSARISACGKDKTNAAAQTPEEALMASVNVRMDDETRKVLDRVENEADARVACAALKRRIDHFEKNGDAVPEALLIAQRLKLTPG